MSEMERPLDRLRRKEEDYHQRWLEQLHGGDGFNRRRDDEFFAAMEAELGPMV